MRDLFMATLVVALLISGTSAQTGRIPLTDLGPGFYLGQFQGGLYEGGANAPPPDHASRGSSHAALIQRLNTSGQPSPIGRIVLISIGMSNTTQEFCSGVNGAQAYNRQFWYGLTGQSMKTCQPWTFGGQAWADPVVEKNALEVVDGAQSGMAAQEWGGEPRSGHGVPWPKVGQRLTAVGLSKQQVQVVWIKLVRSEPGPTTLPSAGADAYEGLRLIGNAVRTAKAEYPNLRLAFVSSRIYGGYDTGAKSPEPHAYENGFTFKWLIQAQVSQLRGGPTDPVAGNLDLTVAPVLLWASYLWADGITPRSDGLTWPRADFETDGVHPTQSGETKVAGMLLNFLKTDPRASCWFLAGAVCAAVRR